LLAMAAGEREGQRCRDDHQCFHGAFFSKHRAAVPSQPMKITAIDTCLLSVPTPKPMALQYPEHKLVIADIATDEGLRGLGYSLVFNGGGAEAVLTYLDTRLKPALIGEDPLFVERLWEKMFRVDMGIRKQGVAAYALSALDIGLWDIAGKAAKQPLYKLWGAVSDRIGAYGSGGWAKYGVDELVAEAEKYAGLGCKYYKMKIHHPDPAVNASRVAAVKKALGSGMRMMVDVNQGRDLIGNQRQARLLEEFDLLWYEEPVLADDYDGYAEVARSIRIPIAGGENHYTRWEFKQLFDRKCVQYAMPDVCRANGFSETLRIGKLAAAHGIALTPHLIHEIAIHVVGALANGFLVEFMDWAPPDLFIELPGCKDGVIRIPDRPGHGMALAPTAIEKYRSR
jgi:L-alanine-DL-glutamate epimerase-like enolase superfamily enzyme